MEKHRERITRGMLERGYTADFAAQLFEQIKGFGSYGFPESHAASFAGIVYASCWLKCHHPAAYACALLNAQPMGFYAPSKIVQDLQRHRVAVRPVDVRSSNWDCTLEVDPKGGWALRLGMRQVRGLREMAATALVEARKVHAFRDAADLCARAGLDKRDQEALADAGALRGLAGHRHRAHWVVTGVEAQLPLFGNESPREVLVALPLPSQAEDTEADYARVGISLGAHPLRQLRPRLRAARCLDSRALQGRPNGSWVRVAGLVVMRQRPSTASGVTFVSMEDEYGLINLIVWRQVAETYRQVFLASNFLAVEGEWQLADGSAHVIVRHMRDLSGLWGSLEARSRDFR
jgi:error-prone DNA polymerase